MKKNMLMSGIVILYLILLTSLSGCVGVENPESPWRKPHPAMLAIDSNDKIYIIWVADTKENLKEEIYYMKLDNMGNTLTFKENLSDFRPDDVAIDPYNNLHIIDSMHYMKIDSNGTILLDNMWEPPSYQSDYKCVTDSKGNVHMVWVDSRNDPSIGDYKFLDDVYYKKLDGSGNVLVNDLRVTNSSINRGWGDYKLNPRIVVDSFENAHVTWEDEANHKLYHALLSKGETQTLSADVVVNATCFVKNSAISIDSNDNIYIFWEEYSSSIYSNSIYTYYKKLDINGTVENMVELDPQIVEDANVDFNNNICILGINGKSIKYTKLDSQGSVLTTTIVYKGYYLDEKDDDSWEDVYNPKIAVDSQNNVHVVWYAKKTVIVWKGERYADYREEDYYTVYYSKLDSNGNILIDKKVIDADEDNSEELKEYYGGVNYMPFFMVCAAVVVIIFLVIVIVVIVKWKKGRDERLSGGWQMGRYPPPPPS